MNDDIQPAKLRHCLVYGFCAVFRPGEIGGGGEAPASGRLRGCFHLFCRRSEVAGGDGPVGAAAGQFNGDGGPQAYRAAGDQGGFAL